MKPVCQAPQVYPYLCETLDTMHFITQTVRHAWRNKKVVSALFLDIEGAFPHADIDQLTHDLRSRRYPKALADFIHYSSSNRSTILKFDDYESKPTAIDCGIGQ